jgi:hypothetical protein
MRSLPWLLLTTLVVAGQAVRQEVSHAPVKGTSFPKIQLNDNHRPAGHQHDHVLTLSLNADTGMWYPAGENEPTARRRSRDHSYESQPEPKSAHRLETPFPAPRLPSTDCPHVRRRRDSLMNRQLSSVRQTRSASAWMSRVRITIGAQPPTVPSKNAIARIRNSRAQSWSILPAPPQTPMKRFSSSEFG